MPTDPDGPLPDGPPPAAGRGPGLLPALLREQAPHLTVLPLRPLAGGQDNAVVRVGERFAARLPRTEQAAQLLRHEQRWLPLLARRLPLPVPVPLLRGRPGSGFPYPWSILPWLPGETADAGLVDPAGLVPGLVEVLRALHVPAPPAAPRHPLRGVPLEHRLPRYAVALAGHPRAGQLQDALTALARVPGPQGPPLWVHGDLHPRNLLVHDGVLAAVLDFGDLHAGDRAVDLGGLWLLLPEPQREAVRESLALDHATWQRGRGWGLVLGALLRQIGLREHDAGFVRLGDRALDQACPP